ncbi:MAG: dTMP kinase [Clostridia bacterium]|nr:dTMP kinase [Clostridia bacterium]
MKNRGKFIVFEGTDGSGKSTQMKMLASYLNEMGARCYLTHEPTDSPVGSLLRSCLTGRIDADEHTIAALFAADRLDHIHNPVNGILKKLNEGVNVLCDRYYLSSFAYNGGFVPLEWVIELNRPAREALKPDLTVFLYLDAEDSMERVMGRGETERYETVERQKKIRKNYLDLIARFPDENVATVVSEADKRDTQEKIRKAVNGLFGWRE